MKKVNKLGLLCCLVYFVSYITRIDYGAALAEIVNDLGVTKEAASYAVTGCFITYGIGQIISGILGDRFKPRKLITFGLIGTSLINLSMVLLPTLTLMTVVWCFNGFFQAFMWPPLVRIMAENMNESEYAASIRNVSAAASVATIAIYVIVPAAIALSGWRLAFVFAAVCGLSTAFVWAKLTVNIKEEPAVKKADRSERASIKGSGVIALLIPAMVALVMQGTLRDGITTWMPSYISEVFDMGVSVSILTTAILPIFSIFSVSMATELEKRIGNPVETAAIFFGIGLISCALMLPFFEKSVALCSLLMAVITACMHGVNLMLIGRLPKYFSKFGKVSTVSGILNSCTYVGSALSTYGFAVLSDKFGWGFTIGGWALIALVGTALCIVCMIPWRKFGR